MGIKNMISDILFAKHSKSNNYRITVDGGETNINGFKMKGCRSTIADIRADNSGQAIEILESRIRA